jgi:hypothetical protein
MPYPPFADIETNYTAFQQGQGNNSFPGRQIDTDLENLAESVDTLNQFVRGFSRSDGDVGNQTIGHDQLKPELSIGLAPPTTWTTATAYEAGDTVFVDLAYYRATADHTSSGSFATDSGAGLWETLIDFEEGLAEGLVDVVEPIVEGLVPGITEDVLAQVPALVAPMIAAASLRPLATIRHVRDGDVFADVIRVVNPLPDTVRVRVVDGTNVGTGLSTRLAPRAFARQKYIPAVANFNAFRNSDGSGGFDSATLVPNSFLIADGVAYAPWSSGTNTARVEGFTVQSDGTMIRRTRGVGDVADYVADGAVFGCAWGAWLLEDGVDVSAAGAAWMDATISARSIFGRASNGDWILIQTQGVTDEQGIEYGDCAALAVAHGCADAFLYEGGGSAQIWWDHFYAHPSSDNDWGNERTLPTFLAIDCPLQEYDTGFIQFPLETGFTAQASIGVRLRQVGAQVHLEAGIAGSFTTSSAAVTEDVTDTFRRFMPKGGYTAARMFVAGVDGAPGVMFAGGPFSARATDVSTTYLAGTACWPARHGV